MAAIVLQALDTTKEEVIDFLLDTLGQKLDVIVPIYGAPYLTESFELQHQFLMAASLGESLVPFCSHIEHVFDEEDKYEFVIFRLVPLDIVTFVDQLWTVAVPYMCEEMREALGYDDVATSEFGIEAAALLKANSTTLHFPALMALVEEFSSDESE